MPIPFDLEEYLSDIKIHRQRRGSVDAKRYILFVLDTSGSIGRTNFEKVLDVLSDFVPLFCNGTFFAIMTFGDIMKKEICFNCETNTITSTLDSITYRHGPQTRTGEAAKYACQNMLISNCKYNIPRVTPIVTDVIFVTDGQSNGLLDVCVETKCFETVNNRYNNLDLYVFAFGIGSNVRDEELGCIIGNRGNAASKFNLLSFDQFEQLKDQTYSQLIAGSITCFTPDK